MKNIKQLVKNRVQNEEDVAKVIHEFEESIKNKKQTNKQTKNIVWLAYHQAEVVNVI